MHLLRAAIVAGVLAGCGTVPYERRDVRHLLVGEWEVLPRGFYSENPDGSRFFPFGEDAVGRVILTASGYAANQFQRKERSVCSTGTSPMNCTTDEAATAFKSAVAYQYRYTIEPEAENQLRGRIIWHVDFVMYPNWQDQILPRQYEMSPDGNSWVFIAPLPLNPKQAVKVHLQRIA